MYAKFGTTPAAWHAQPAPSRYFLEMAWVERCDRLTERREQMNDQLNR